MLNLTLSKKTNCLLQNSGKILEATGWQHCEEPVRNISKFNQEFEYFCKNLIIDYSTVCFLVFYINIHQKGTEYSFYINSQVIDQKDWSIMEKDVDILIAITYVNQVT